MELFRVGINRIIYKASNFLEGLAITAYILDPDFNKSDKLYFIEIGDGFYYIDFDFSEEGMYVVKIYENEIAKSHGFYRIDPKISRIVNMLFATKH